MQRAEEPPVFTALVPEEPKLEFALKQLSRAKEHGLLSPATAAAVAAAAGDLNLLQQGAEHLPSLDTELIFFLAAAGAVLSSVL